MRKHMWAVVIAVLIVVFGVLVLAVPSARTGDDESKVIPPDSVAYGKTFGEWSAAWNQWADSIPVANHPLFDNGPCSVGQSGPVWFLGGKFCANYNTNCGFTGVTRSCTVPAGKALFFPVVDVEDSALEESSNGNPSPTKGQIADMRAYSASNLESTTNVFCRIDGVAIPHLKQIFRVQSTAFGFTFPDDNIFKAVYPANLASFFPAGTYFPAVDDGVYLMVPPLPVGQHVIHFGGSFPGPFSFDITYHLTVSK